MKYKIRCDGEPEVLIEADTVHEDPDTGALSFSLEGKPVAKFNKYEAWLVVDDNPF